MAEVDPEVGMEEACVARRRGGVGEAEAERGGRLRALRMIVRHGRRYKRHGEEDSRPGW